MRRAATSIRFGFFGALLVFAACGSAQSPVSAPLSPTPVIPSFPARAITLGQQVADTFRVNDFVYALTAPNDGTLVVTLDWDPSQGNPVDVAHLELVVGLCAMPDPYGDSCPTELRFQGPAPLYGPPAVGRIAVTSGQTYRIVIEEGVAPWDYGFLQPFELSTAIQ